MKFALRRGIEPRTLLDWVRNTAPFAFTMKGYPYLERLQRYGGEELSHSEYFHLCLCAHWATVGTFIPTDVDNAIRLKLWQMPESEGHREAMVEMTLEAGRWDYSPVTAKKASGLSTHEGTWFSVAVGAYAATGSRKILDAMVAEAEREDKVWKEILASGDGLEILRACALLAHNFGDLDRVVDMWNIPQGDPLRGLLYDAAKPGSPLFGGRLGYAGAMNQRFMAAENHRYLALREPRFLRSKAEFLLPVGPFLDDWGRRLSREDGEKVGELVEALLKGIAWTPGSVAYARALAGILEVFPGGMEKLKRHIPARAERDLRGGAIRKLIDEPRERFEGRWSRFWKQIPRPG